jgi:hypothetical protein
LVRPGAAPPPPPRLGVWVGWANLVVTGHQAQVTDKEP